MASVLKSAPLESAIEAEAVRRARRDGWLAIKQGGAMTGNKRGWPDRLFIRLGVYIFVEFKRPGNSLTLIQEKRHAELREQLCAVYVCWSADECDEYLRRERPGSNYFPGCEDL
jgi:hypothetical protein